MSLIFFDLKTFNSHKLNIQYENIKIILGSHSVNKQFACTHCGKKFKQKSHLNHHVKLKHSDGAFDSKYKCDICGKGLTSNYSLKKHKMLHWDNKPFVCLVCGKRFVQNSHLTLHVQKHSGIRSHLCIECGKSFTTKGHLKEHMKFHTGERKVYECMECKAQYFGLHDLKVLWAFIRRNNYQRSLKGRARLTTVYSKRLSVQN